MRPISVATTTTDVGFTPAGLQDGCRAGCDGPRPRSEDAILLGPMLGRSRKPHNACQRLRSAVEAMPRSSREAMLKGMNENTIVVGAYTDPKSGGICPMLAAHRNGGRTDLASFARCWDRYTDARRPRMATDREVLTLRSLLELSLVGDDAATDTLAVTARRIRAERADMRAAEGVPSTERAVAPVSPPEPSGMRIRIRRLVRRERDAREPANIG